MTRRPPAPDQAERDRAIRERAGNVVVDAGAGTGKTTLLVDRLVSMVAPEDGADPVPLSSIAAITFTRKAAGELKLRIRERLLAELAGGVTGARRDLLSHALADADTAFIGTIHGFADRLLRRHPVEACLGPDYEIVEEADALHAETFELLLQAAEAGRLADELRGTSCASARAEEAQEAIRLALAAELRAESWEAEWTTYAGLDRLVAGFLVNRDVPPADAKPARFERQSVLDALGDFRRLAARSSGPLRGSRVMAEAVERIDEVLALEAPADLFREVADLRRRVPKLQLKNDFGDDREGWKAYKAWTEGQDDGPPLREAAMAPLARWMATRLVRVFPAAVAMYEQVKARRRVVDQVDLLLKLRDLLRDRRDVRADLQRLFRHLFVDEFQDTDPLQAEIVLFLCEDGAKARDWRGVRLAPGRLTLVGDPKQSIYRFRRADLAVYEAVRARVREGPHVVASLSANFRSEPALIEHLNARYDELLGTTARGGEPFDAEGGTVTNQPLLPGRPRRREQAVLAIPLQAGEGRARAGPERRLEAQLLARWIRRAVEDGSVEVVDPATGAPRPAGYGDVAVLAHSTFHVGLLVAELDRLGVPWSVRGGSLFLEDPLHRQLLLALRGIADRDDGLAQAALLRPPFFDVTLADLARDSALGVGETGDAGILRARAARALVEELRYERHARTPGATARDLLDRTGFARAVAFGPNGAQRLERLRELCLEVERLAVEEGLDFDAVTLRLRAWAVEPVQLDPPRPVGGDAVQVMTIHQAKGLEFPVVAWWDGHAKLAPRGRSSAWFVSRTGDAWAIELDGLSWEEPEAGGLVAREDAWLAAERLRLVYVAGTRARDLLVLPIADGCGAGSVTRALLGPEDGPAVEALEASEGEPAAWALAVAPPPARRPTAAADLSARIEAAWAEATGEAGRPLHVPVGVSTEAHRLSEAEEARDGDAGEWEKERESRFGRIFGDTVHEAIGVALRDAALSAEAAVARVARTTGLGEHQAEAAQDVARALDALAREGLRRVPDEALRLEYPVAKGADGRLLVGYVDLLAARDGEVLVLDFKTDAPPQGDVAKTHPAYVEQVRSYGRILVELGIAEAGKVRAGLLFTADGGVRWV